MDLTPGTVVGGDFRIVRRLAQGGMGAVYVADQLSTGQQRALKLMHPTLVAAPGARERFVQESRVGSQIASEHVVQVIAAGVDATLGVPWLAMELLAGEDLGAYSERQGPLPFDEVVRIFRPTCHALGAAHAAGIAHRDIKPENIFLASALSADTTQHVKVLDFGIAKLVAEAKDTATAQVGTPLWMAPEQTDPSKTISGASDVWSLGLVAFKLLVGQPYWRTARDPNASLQALLKESLVDPLVPASQRATEYGMGHALPPGFDAWFARAVVREPERRFPSAREAFVALENLASVPTLASAGVHTPAHSAPAHGHSGAPPAWSPSTPAPAPEKKSNALWWVLGGLAILVVIPLLLMGGGALMYFGLQSGDDATAGGVAASPAPLPAAPTTEAPAQPSEGEAADPVADPKRGGASQPPRGGSVSPTNKSKPGAPAAVASAAPQPTESAAPTGGLAPFDASLAKSKVDAAVSQATSKCSAFKNPDAGSETYTGTVYFRSNGGANMLFAGVGGARKCVNDTMHTVYYGVYDGDSTKPQPVKFAVTIK